MDKICISMPSNLQDFLYALAVMQGYQAMLGVEAAERRRDPYYQVTVRVSDEFQYFEPCFQVFQENKPIVDYTGWNVQERGEYDCFINFDEDMFRRAKALAIPSKRHITEALGILIGCKPPKWPINFAALQLHMLNSGDGVLLTGADTWDSNKFCDLLDYNGKGGCCDEPSLEMVPAFPTVVGRHCSETYFASALKKTVIELFPDNESFYLYNNQGRANYRYHIGDASAELVFTLFEDLQQEHTVV